MAFGLAKVCAQGLEIKGTFGLDNSFNQSSRGIMREQGIAYYEFRGQGYFVHVPAFSGSLKRVPTPRGWYIRDFHVLNDIAYFCGIDSSDYTALLGHFNVGELIAGLTNVNFHRDFGIVPRMTILNRIAVYDCKDSVAVMSIGREQRGINPDMDGADRVVYLSNYLSNIKGRIYTPSSTTELFWDVLVTDNNFVTAGTDGNPTATSTLTMHSVPIGTWLDAFTTIFSSNGYRYQGSDIYLSGVRATYLKNDSIVMAAYIGDAANNLNYMALHTIYVPTAQMTVRQEKFTNITYMAGHMLPPKEMVYLSDLAVLMVIDTNDSNAYTNISNTTHIARLTPYDTVAIPQPWNRWYVIPLYYSVSGLNTAECKIPYSSLVATSGSSCMAAGGANWLRLDLQGSILPPQHHHNTCIGSRNTDCFISTPDTTNPYSGGVSITYPKSWYDTTREVEEYGATSCTPGSNVPFFWIDEPIEKE